MELEARLLENHVPNALFFSILISSLFIIGVILYNIFIYFLYFNGVNNDVNKAVVTLIYFISMWLVMQTAHCWCGVSLAIWTLQMDDRLSPNKLLNINIFFVPSTQFLLHNFLTSFFSFFYSFDINHLSVSLNGKYIFPHWQLSSFQ